jgi:hypothetical protein
MLDQAERDGTGDPVRGGDGIEIIPYVHMGDGHWTLPDETILALYAELQRERTAENISGSTIHTPEEFLAFVRSPGIFPIVMALWGDVGGAAWLTHAGRYHAWVHVVFLKWAHGPIAHRLAGAAFRYWDAMDRDGEPLLKVLLGATPVAFKPAVAFAKRVGFTILGEVPYVEDGDPVVFSYRVNERCR